MTRLRTMVMTTVSIDPSWNQRAKRGFGLWNRTSSGASVTVTFSRAGSHMHRDPPNSDPAELLGRVAVHDSDALSTLYDLTSDLVYGVALRVIRSPEIAEEVTQEVFLQIWQQASSFDPDRGSAKAWVATLAHRRAVDAVRRSQSARDREDKVLPDLPTDNVADRAIASDERSRLRAALSSLSDLQYQAIEMAYYEGLTYREVAERLDTPLGTVKSRMRDGLMRLRETFGDDHG